MLNQVNQAMPRKSCVIPGNLCEHKGKMTLSNKTSERCKSYNLIFCGVCKAGQPVDIKESEVNEAELRMSLNANQLQSLGGSRQLLELESVVKVSGGLFSALLFCSIKGYYSYSNVTQVKKDVYIFLIFACVSPWGKYTYIIQQSRHQDFCFTRP